MARVYVNLLYAGMRTWNQIPDTLKREIKSIFRADVACGVITPERYEEITGEPYAA